MRDRLCAIDFGAKKVPKKHLTDLVVQRLNQPGTYWDDTPGFGLRVGKNRKTWVVMRGRDRRRTRVGHYPALSLSDARKKALVLLGSDPPDAAPRPISFADARQKFFDVHVLQLKPLTQREIKRVLVRHFNWTKTLDKITPDDVATVIEGIKAKSEAWHALKDIRTFFRWCVPRYLKHSPTEGLKSPYRYIPRKRVLTPVELVSVWRAAGRAGYPFGTVVKLLVLTGQRYGEIVSLRWEFVNVKEQLITFPDTKNGRPHTFPYNGLVARVLEGIPRRNTTALLFPGRDPELPWNGAGKAKFLLEDHPPIRPWTLHDLRRTTATMWAMLKVPPHIVERLLNHRLGTLQSQGVISAVAEVYNTYLYLDEMREAVERYDRYLVNLLQQP